MIAACIVNRLLETGEDVDPKEMAMEMPVSDLTAIDIIQEGYNTILALPYANLDRFYVEAPKIVSDMVARLEQLLGRRALDGTREMLMASAPKPWNYDTGHRMSRKHAREILSSFRACSKRVKKA